MPQSDVMSLMVILSIFLCWRSFLRDASKASFVVFDMDFSSFQFLLKNMFKNITGISYLYGGNSLFISRLYIQANQQGQTHLSTFKAPFLYYNVPDTKQKCGNIIRFHKWLCFRERFNKQTAKNTFFHPYINNIEQYRLTKNC